MCGDPVATWYTHVHLSGNSCGAIVISNGKVIGLNIAAVKGMLDLAAVDFGSVVESINQLCDAQQ